MFVPGKAFQPSLIFAGKAGAHPVEAPERCVTQVGSGKVAEKLPRMLKYVF